MSLEITAAAIAKIAFEAAIGKLTEGALSGGLELWKKIKGKLKKEPAVETAIVEAEQMKSEEIVQQRVVPFLQVEMIKDPEFAREIQTLAQQIRQEISAGNQENISLTATAHDNSTVKQVGKIEADTVNF
ncbi:hypothetical protein V0288_01495 [Pannus brasiliensis CCIBt3594]|uniref:Uncharacterized protein n=1 Tax=Pannus brasiliensis CCIBt3594 TaxID=1427578 RepID=A0AAW9QQC0_9CHRO